MFCSNDGGRIRIRKNKRDSKRRKIPPDILLMPREPKLLIIYVVDDKLGLDKANQVLFVADDAGSI